MVSGLRRKCVWYALRDLEAVWVTAPSEVVTRQEKTVWYYGPHMKLFVSLINCRRSLGISLTIAIINAHGVIGMFWQAQGRDGLCYDQIQKPKVTWKPVLFCGSHPTAWGILWFICQADVSLKEVSSYLRSGRHQNRDWVNSARMLPMNLLTIRLPKKPEAQADTL